MDVSVRVQRLHASILQSFPGAAIMGGMSELLALFASASLAASISTRARVIVALGDSTTAGTPYFQSPLESPPAGRGDASAPYPYWVERAMPGWKVPNRGINGERTDEIRARFERDVVAARPRYVLILAGVNDVYQGIDLDLIKTNLSWMYRRAAAEGVVPVAASVLPFDRATAEQNRRIAELNAWIAAQAKTLDIPFCDMHSVAADPKDPSRLKGSDDGLHPDRTTYRALGRAAARAILARENPGPKTQGKTSR